MLFFFFSVLGPSPKQELRELVNYLPHAISTLQLLV